jgi:hypothetical protein
MDQNVIVEQLMNQCKRLIDKILNTPDLQSVAAASLRILEHIREVARAILQAKVDLEAGRLKHKPVTSCCPGADMDYIHTRSVSPTTLFGKVEVPVRTFRCTACHTTVRPDDALLGLPKTGAFSDDVRMLYSPLAAELPHRVSNDIFWRFTGVDLSSCGAQSIIDSSAQELASWRCGQETTQSTVVKTLLDDQQEAPRLRLEIAMDGVKAHIDGGWQEPKVGTILVRQLPKASPRAIRGAVVARRYVCVLGSADELVRRIKATIHQAGWQDIEVAEILGDGAAWIWNVADVHFPGIPQVLDYYHLSEHFYEVAHVLYPNSPDQAKTWVEGKLSACLRDRVGDVMGALKRIRPREPTVRRALEQLVGYVENNRSRIRYKTPWYKGLAVGSGSVEGACKHVIQARFKRAGMRWKEPGFLHILELRVARLNDTLDAFWAAGGLKMPAVS